jgi:hypothetical protein
MCRRGAKSPRHPKRGSVVIATMFQDKYICRRRQRDVLLLASQLQGIMPGLIAIMKL